MKTKIYFTLFLLIALWACKSESKQTNGTASIDLSELSTPSFYDYFSRMDVIPLETNDSSLVNNVDKIVHRNNKFYIMDVKARRIAVFGDNGKYLREINRCGPGPGEYTDLRDFGFNEFTGELELLSPMSGILRYDSIGNEFKGKIHLPEGVPAVHYFQPLEKGIYLLFSQSKPGKKLLVYDAEHNKVLSEMYDIPKFILFSTVYHHVYTPFYMFDNQLHFVQGYNGDVFTIEKNGMELKYHWDFGEQNFSIEGLPEHDVKYYLKYANTTGAQYANAFTEYGENSRYYMTVFLYAKDNVTLIYDKQQKKTVVFNKFREGDWTNLQFMDEQAAYGYLNPGWPFTSKIIESMDASFKEKFKQMKPEDNPYIVKCTFK